MTSLNLKYGVDGHVEPNFAVALGFPRLNALRERNSFLAGVFEPCARPAEEREERERKAFTAFLRDGWNDLTPEQRRLGCGYRNPEDRAQSTETTGGGYVIQGAYERQFIALMKQYDPILEIGTEFETPTAAAGDFPIDDDVVVGEVLAENGQATQTDSTFSSLPLVKCPKHCSKALRVSLELEQDAFQAFEKLVAPTLQRRIARSVAATAVAKLLTDADVAATTAAAGVVTGSEILDLMGAVDPAHSQVGVFLMAEATLTSLKKLTTYTAGYFPNMIGTDSEGRATLFGKSVYSSPSMPAIGANNKPVAFGNFRRFYIRRVANSLVLKHLIERYGEYGQRGFLMFWRAQGALAKSTNTPTPVRLLQCHS